MGEEHSAVSIYEGKAHGPIELADTVVAIELDGKPCEFRDVSLRLDEHLDLQLSWTGPLNPGIALIDQDLKVTFEGGTTAEFLMLSHKYHFVTVQPFDHFLALGDGGVRLPLLRTMSHRALLRSLDSKPLKAAKLYEFLGQICSFLGFIKGTRVGYGEVRKRRSQRVPRSGIHPIGAALMLAVEQEARHRQRSLLLLDTAMGSEKRYRGLGWQQVGVVPHHFVDPFGSPKSSVYSMKFVRLTLSWQKADATKHRSLYQLKYRAIDVNPTDYR